MMHDGRFRIFIFHPAFEGKTPQERYRLLRRVLDQTKGFHITRKELRKMASVEGYGPKEYV